MRRKNKLCRTKFYILSKRNFLETNIQNIYDYKNSGIVADKNTKNIQWTVQNGQWEKKVRAKFLRLDIEYLFILRRRKEQQCCNVKQYRSYLSRFESYRIILLKYLSCTISFVLCFFEIFYPRLAKKKTWINSLLPLHTNFLIFTNPYENQRDQKIPPWNISI